MTDVNHRRKNRKPVNQRQGTNRACYNNGSAWPNNKVDGISQRIGKTDYLDKSMLGWGVVDTFSDKHIGACIGNDFSQGHRGMAKSVRGAKKFVRSRVRFHEKATTRKNSFIEEDDE